MVEASALEQFEQTIRLDEQRKQEIALLLRELRDAQINNTEQYNEIMKKVDRIERLLEATYKQNDAIYTLICGERYAELAGADELRRELESRALDRDTKEARDRMTIRASAKRDLELHVDGDVVGGSKDD